MKGKTKAFDPSKLTLITPNRRKSEPFDLRYTKASRFRFSKESWENLNLDNLGVSMFKYPGGAIVLSVQTEETSQVLRQREGSTRKGTEFTSTELARLLGLTDEQTDFQLNLLSVADDVTYLTIVSFSQKQFTTDSLANTASTVAETTTTELVNAAAETTEEIVEAVFPDNIQEDVNEDTDESGQDSNPEKSEELDSTVFDGGPDGENTESVPEEDPLEFLKED